MIGDKLVIEPHHTERGAEICEYLMNLEASLALLIRKSHILQQ